ncbi:MAG: CehA/McbA family metallohydrolase, partial [Cyclobacteriaceae bacterium]|nr:CehA/McbA family metallohydrolase [Cyclobacteriaceae bacterium]
GMTMDVLDGKVDFLELLQFCVEGGPLLTQNYYHYLDLGYKLTATAGSDFPWCGNGANFGTEAPSWCSRIGDVRFYTHIDGQFDYPSWKENMIAGHTFVSSGPMVLFKVNDKLPGDEIDLASRGNVTISAEGFGHQQQVPLSKLEIIAHGKVIKEITPGSPGQTSENLTINLDLKIEKGIWIAARCYAGPNQIAHTTPVYISVNNGGFKNDETLQDYLALNEKYLVELEDELNEPSERANQRAWWYKKGLKQRIENTRKIINSLKEQ